MNWFAVVRIKLVKWIGQQGPPLHKPPAKERRKEDRRSASIDAQIRALNLLFFLCTLVTGGICWANNLSIFAMLLWGNAVNCAFGLYRPYQVWLKGQPWSHLTIIPIAVAFLFIGLSTSIGSPYSQILRLGSIGLIGYSLSIGFEVWYRFSQKD